MVHRRLYQRGAATPLKMVGLLAVLLLSWVLWSGIYKPLLLWLGAFSCLLSLWLAQRMGFFNVKVPGHSIVRLPLMLWWLLREVVKSSIDVARMVLSPSMPISPTVVELTTELQADTGKVILGNAITLSPGTVTIDVYKQRLLVHCLTEEAAAGLQDGEAERRIARLGID